MGVHGSRKYSVAALRPLRAACKQGSSRGERWGMRGSRVRVLPVGVSQRPLLQAFTRLLCLPCNRRDSYEALLNTTGSPARDVCVFSPRALPRIRPFRYLAE